jgi:tRNA (guanine-N7-)-methyltransferase
VRQKYNPNATNTFFDMHGVLYQPKMLDVHGEVHLEIGSGKGKFITEMALDHPHITFIAFEINRHVAYYIALKKEEKQLHNLIIIIDHIQHIFDYVKPHVIDTIYLNFSDPWPKAKHHKRRLSYPTMLSLYQKVLKPDGSIEMRTDHQALYIDSCLYMQSLFNNIEYDDHTEPFTYASEYELKKRPLGPIYYIKAKVTHEPL